MLGKLFFRYGQLSGIVEPIFGVLGALAVAGAQPLLPYALAFAAGAMIYVVVDDIIPEAHARYQQFIILITTPPHPSNQQLIKLIFLHLRNLLLYDIMIIPVAVGDFSTGICCPKMSPSFFENLF